MLALWPGPAAHAGDVGGEGFLVESWKTENGLPQSTILSIAQTPDGFLWLATFNGLVRFDGVTFTVFNPANTPELRSGRIVELGTDRQGSLWVFTEEDDLIRMANGRFERANGKWGLPNGRLVAKATDPSGNLWVGSRNSSADFRFSDDHFVPGTVIDSPSESEMGQITSAPGALWLARDGHWDRVPMAPVREYWRARGLENVDVATRSRDGGVWLFARRQVQNHNRPVSWPFPPGQVLPQATAMVEDTKGNLWVTTWTDGLIVIPPGGPPARVPLENDGAVRALRTLFVDVEGNVWIGSDVAGLFRVKPRVFRTYTRADGLDGEVIKSVIEDSAGRIWAARDNGINWILPGGAVAGPEYNPAMRSSPRNYRALWTVGQDASEEFWFGCFNGKVSHWNETSGEVVCEPAGDGSPGAVHVLARGVGNGLWVGTSRGLWRGQGDTVSRSPLPPGLPSEDVRAIIEDSTGLFYAGIYGAGLLRREGGVWSRFGKEQGLADESVLCLYRDNGGAVWIGTVFGGLSRFKDGQIVNFAAINPGIPNLVSCSIEDDLGSLWFGGVDGIHRVSRTELEEVAAGTRQSAFVYVFAKGDGLRTTECAYGMQPTVVKDRNGRLWFATINGLSVIDPGRLPINSRPPPVRITEIRIDGRVVAESVERNLTPTPSQTDFTTKNQITVPPGNHSLEIRYTGLSFTSPEKMRFQYRLEEANAEWREAGGRRAAYFEGLQPGAYRFRVKACNNDGIWNTSGASVAVLVLPYYWQTSWFGAGVCASVGGLVLAFYRRRISRLERDRALQRDFSRRLIDSQESERKRIAGELHDSLGQNLLIIKNRATLAGIDPSTPPKVLEQIREISDVSLQSIQEVRTIAQALRPHHLERFGLSKSIKAMVRQLGEGGPVRIESEVAPLEGLLSPDEEMNLYRILQESLNNIVKHSGAASARIRVLRDVRCVRIVIEDDGRGFEPGEVGSRAPEQPGFGLTSIGERVKMLGGTWQIRSAPGQGARIEIELPIENKSHA